MIKGDTRDDHVTSSDESQNNVDEDEEEEDVDDIACEQLESCESSDDGNSKLSRFILGKQIGQGAYAVVRVATCKKDNKKYAIKVYDKSKLTDSNRQRSVRREIKLLQKMNHANIVKIYEAFETDDHVYLVMEYVGGGSLHSYLREKSNRRLEENDAKRIFKQIMTALQYCHRKSIAHRDIKLENILLDEQNNVKLIDFGFSTCIPNDKKIKMFCGTPSYMAPEIVMKEEYAGPPADIWASAVLLYALMNGCFPYRGASDKELYRRIQRGTFVLQNPTVSDQFVELLSRMLNTNADQRPTADDVLEDIWFKQEWKSNALAKQSHEQEIAEQKRQFKAKILGKIPVEKNKNTICLNGSQEQLKNLMRQNIEGGINQVGSNQVNQNFNPQNNFQQYQNNHTNNAGANDFTDYGLQQQNIMKKLNQEAYQAYYNTSGANYGNSGNATAQNPYYNNFFQNNFAQNMQTTNQGSIQINNVGGFYQNNNQNFQQLKQSPQKQQQTGVSQTPFVNQTIPQPQSNNVGFGFNQNVTSNQNNGAGQNHFGTPQVFGSPTGAAFHCSNGGVINNNFKITQAAGGEQNPIVLQNFVGNPSDVQKLCMPPHVCTTASFNSYFGDNVFKIINNIIMNQPQNDAQNSQGGILSPTSFQPQNNSNTNKISSGGSNSNNDQPLSPVVVEQPIIPLINNFNLEKEQEFSDEVQVGQNQKFQKEFQILDRKIEEEDDLDKDIIEDLVNKLGFNRSQVVSQLINSGEVDNKTQIGQIYTRMKEDKLSKTQNQHRAFSQQPYRRPPPLQNMQGKHNFGIFPNFVPSIPNDEDSSTKKEGSQDNLHLIIKKTNAQIKNAYYDDNYNSGGGMNDDYNILSNAPHREQHHYPLYNNLLQKSPRVNQAQNAYQHNQTNQNPKVQNHRINRIGIGSGLFPISQGLGKEKNTD